MFTWSLGALYFYVSMELPICGYTCGIVAEIGLVRIADECAFSSEYKQGFCG
jgi:hypothetical protein